MKLSEVVKVFMSANGISTTDMAKEIGVSRPTLHNFLTKDSNLGHHSLMRLLEYFDIDVVGIAKQNLLSIKENSPQKKDNNDLETLFFFVDDLQRNYQINYLITLCENILAKTPNRRIKRAINSVKKHYLTEGR